MRNVTRTDGSGRGQPRRRPGTVYSIGLATPAAGSMRTRRSIGGRRRRPALWRARSDAHQRHPVGRSLRTAAICSACLRERRRFCLPAGIQGSSSSAGHGIPTWPAMEPLAQTLGHQRMSSRLWRTAAPTPAAPISRKLPRHSSASALALPSNRPMAAAEDSGTLAVRKVVQLDVPL